MNELRESIKRKLGVARASDGNADGIITDAILDAVIAALPEKRYTMPVGERMMTTTNDFLFNQGIDEAVKVLQAAKESK